MLGFLLAGSKCPHVVTCMFITCSCTYALEHGSTMCEPWWYCGAETQVLSICQGLVWSQQQNGTILFHSAWYRRSQMTANYKTNVIPFSEVLLLTNWGKSKTNLFQCHFLVICRWMSFVFANLKEKIDWQIFNSWVILEKIFDTWLILPYKSKMYLLLIRNGISKFI